MGIALEGTAAFEFGGKRYQLTLNNRVLMEAEDVLGYSALDAAEEAKAALAVGRNPMLRTVVALFYGALVQHHREVSQDEAIDMFLSAEDPAAQEAFKAILRGTDVPDVSGNGVAAAPATRSAKNGAGSGSSKAGAKRASRRKSSS